MKITRYLLLFACFLPLCIFRDYTPNNELKYLSIADEALRNGHFFTFWNHGEVYADKPPLYFWMIMLGKWLCGEHYMIFLSLFSIVPALLILYILDKWVGLSIPASSRRDGQLILLTSGLFAGSAIVLRMDMLMCLFILLALYTFYKQYLGKARPVDTFLLPVYIFLAIFTKGPVGILMPLLSIPCFLLWKKQIRDIGQYLGWRTFGILLGLCALWFGAVYLEGGHDYLHNLLFNQTVNRAIDSFRHKEPFWYYFVTIWYSLAPWSIFYIAIILAGIKKRLLKTDLEKFFLIIILSTFIALSFSSSKLDIYLLPIFPFIAYLSFLLLPKLDGNKFRFTIAIPGFLLLLAFPGLFLFSDSLDIPLLKTPLIPVATGLLSLSAGACLYFLFRKKLSEAIHLLSIGILVTIFIGGFAIRSLNTYIGFREISHKAEAIAHDHGLEHYYYYKFRSGENLDVYLKQRVKPLSIQDISELSKQENFILIVKNNHLKKEAELIEITQGCNIYPIGDYSIIIVQFN